MHIMYVDLQFFPPSILILPFWFHKHTWFSPMLSTTVPLVPRGLATRTTTITTTCGATITRRRVRESYDGSCVVRYVSQAREA